MNKEQIIDEAKTVLKDDFAETSSIYIARLELVREPLLELRIDAYKELCKVREQYRMPNYKPDPKDKTTPKYTDFDRKIMLDSHVADVEADYQLVSGLEKLVAERVELIKILLEAK